MSLALIIIGSLGSVITWLFFVRPYVVSRGRGQTTGASIGVPIWADWQTCGEIADAENDPKAKKLYRVFGAFQLIMVIGTILLCFGV